MKPDRAPPISESGDFGSRFQTTRWTLVGAIQGDDQDERFAALDSLVRRCWSPVYAYLRRRGKSPHEAEDLCQGFFADVVLSRRLFEQAEPAKGRLRSLLLTALNNYLIDNSRRDRTRGNQRTIGLPSIPELEASTSTIPTADPDAAFSRAWAIETLNEAISRCREHYTSSGRARHWALFERRELHRLYSTSSPLSLTEVATELEFESPAQAAAAIQTVKRHLKQILEQVVAEGCGEGVDVGAEMNLLATIVGDQR